MDVFFPILRYWNGPPVVGWPNSGTERRKSWPCIMHLRNGFAVVDAGAYNAP
jgi:hypothetical protein